MSRTRYEWTLLDYAIWPPARSPCRSTRRPAPSRSQWILSDSGAVAVVVETAEHRALVDEVARRAARPAHVWQIEPEAPDAPGAVERARRARRGRARRRRCERRRAGAAPTTWPRSSTPPAPPAGPRAASSPTATCCPRCSDGRRAAPGAVQRRRVDAAVPAAGARVRPVDPVRRHATRARSSATPPDVEEPARRPGGVPADVPARGARGCSRRSTTPPGSRRTPTARARSSTAPPTPRSPRARRWTPAARRSGCGSSTRCSTGWSTASCGRRSAAVRRRDLRRRPARRPARPLLPRHRPADPRGLRADRDLRRRHASTRSTRSGSARVGRPLPGHAVRIADDGEILLTRRHRVPRLLEQRDGDRRGDRRDGWFHTGDIGELDDDGYLTITGRKKEIIVTAGGKNVAPAVLEDRLRAHPLVSQCMVVGDQQPFIGRAGHHRPGGAARLAASATASRPATRSRDLVDDPELRAEIQAAVDDANKAVSQAEAIREFRILPVDFTEAGGELTPSLKVKRATSWRRSTPTRSPRIYARHQAARLSRRRRPGRAGPAPSERTAGGAGGDRTARSSRARIHARPAAPMAAARVRVGEQAGEGVGERRRRSRPSTTWPVAPVLHGLRRAAGVAGHHRQAGRRRLQADDAEPLDVQPAAAGAARHREDVAGGVVGGQLGRRHRAGEHHVLGDPAAGGEPRAAARRSGPPPTSSSRVRAPAPGRRGRARISASWPLRGTSRDTQATTGRVAEAVPAAQLGARRRIGPERRRCRRRAAAAPGRRRAERGGDPAAGVVARGGERRRCRGRSGAAPAGRRAASTSRPRGRACWRRTRATPARAAQRRRRAGRAARPRRTRRCRTPCARASSAARAGDAGRRQHQRRRVAVHRVTAARASNSAAPAPGGRVRRRARRPAAGRRARAGRSGCRRAGAGSRW